MYQRANGTPTENTKHMYQRANGTHAQHPQNPKRNNH